MNKCPCLCEGLDTSSLGEMTCRQRVFSSPKSIYNPTFSWSLDNLFL